MMKLMKRHSKTMYGPLPILRIFFLRTQPRTYCREPHVCAIVLICNKFNKHIFLNFAFFNSTSNVVTHNFLKRKCSRVDSSQKNFKSLNLYNNHVFAPQVKIFRCITFMAPNTDPSYPLNCLYWNISIFLKGKLNISKLALKVNKRENF